MKNMSAGATKTPDTGFGLFNGLFKQREEALQQAARAAMNKGEPTPKEIDALIAKEMTRMTMDEREKALEDVHGILDIHEEDPAAMKTRLAELDTKLQTLKAGTAYELAEALNRQYVRNESFRMMFLRADRYDVDDVADRMIAFFELKKELFGHEKLVKDITLDDFDEDDMETLESGAYQILPHGDMAGRPIFINVMALRNYKAPINVMRTQFYVLMTAMEKTDAQMKGLVAIYYVLDCPNYKSVTGKLRKSIPVHYASFHLCYNDMEGFAKACLGLYNIQPKQRVRYRPHFGTHTECQYELSTFGIPRTALPISPQGVPSTDYHEIWLQTRRNIDAEKLVSPTKILERPYSTTPVSVPASSATSVTSEDSFDERASRTSSSSCFVEPTPNDVLFGRGKTVVEHPGNARFRNTVDMYLNQYEAASRSEKTRMAEAIVKMIYDSNGRFLKREGDSGAWEEVTQTTARLKTAHAFRNRRKFHQ